MSASMIWSLLPAAEAFAPPGGGVADHAVPAMPDADVRLDDLDEQSLIAACRDRRPGAFDLLVERHRRPVYQLCYRFVGNHEDASDLSQEVFLRAYRGLRNFRGQSSVATWLYRIGVNVCLNRVSAKTIASEPIAEREFIDADAESPSDQVLRSERAAKVRAA